MIFEANNVLGGVLQERDLWIQSAEACHQISVSVGLKVGVQSIASVRLPTTTTNYIFNTRPNIGGGQLPSSVYVDLQRDVLRLAFASETGDTANK